MNIPISAFPNFEAQVPRGDHVERMVCSQCDWIHYENPRVIVTGFCVFEGQILLARRAIAPRRGYWTLPGGFMEIGESMREGASREVREEANAIVETETLLATYTIARIGQVHMVYLARLSSPDFSPGEESLETRLFPLQQDALPWDELAFPVNEWALRDYLSLGGQSVTQPFEVRREDRDVRLTSVDCHPDFLDQDDGRTV
ncbi:MAG: NUDIX hydrolase [Planctomycetaceae bacterium]|nr:NUDIX hydrolase [Planctomycetaceae bacterium]